MMTKLNFRPIRVRGWGVAVCIAVLIVLASRSRADAPVQWTDPVLRGKIEPTLFKQLVAGGADEALPVIVEMRLQADLAPTFANSTDRATAGALAVESLQAAAAGSQQGVRTFLAAEEQAGRAESVRPLWVINAVGVRAVPQTIWQLAARPDVALVRPDRWRQWVNTKDQISDFNGQDAALYSSRLTIRSPASDPKPQASSPEWGIGKIRADQVWAAFNITGTGVVVANLDTGVDWLHPALYDNYRGCTKSLCQHAASWYDATGDGAQYPQDGNGHGTHTMGTLAGQGGIGVAPGARWIAARVLNVQGYGFDSWIHAGFQWVLAPGGDPAMAPDLVSNSWGNDDGSDTTFRNDVRALQAAGILAVFSNGNNGPFAGTVGSPASLPESFAVGAIDSTDLVATFSSRGPSLWGEIRPHVVAPGVSVRSAWPGGGYKSLSGTSMAAPHVAGVAALVLSAHPGMAITAAAYVLTTTAVPLATTIPNNDSGWGRVDAYAAVMAVTSAGTLSGVVTRADTGAPIPGVSVAVSGAQNISAQTDANGRYYAGIASGIYNVSASAFGYETGLAYNVIISAGLPVTRNFELTSLPTGLVRGSITDAVSGSPVTATVAALGTPITQTVSGAYSLTLPAETYTLRTTALGYHILTTTVAVTAEETITRDLALMPGPKILLVDSGAWYSQGQIGYFQQALDEMGYAYNTWKIRQLVYDAPHGNDLLPYDIVIWSSPLDSPGYVGASNAITTFLTNTHGLMISGQDVAFWDGGGSFFTYSSYLKDYLKVQYVRDDSGSRALNGMAGDIMAGLAMTITGPGGADNQIWPDEIAVSDLDHAAPILAYQGDGLGGSKAGLCLPYRGVVLSFGYEAITDAATRRAVMQRAIDYLAGPRLAAGLGLQPASEMVIARPGDTVTYTLRLRNISEVAGDVVTVTATGGSWPFTYSPGRVAINSCETATVTLTVTVPAGLGWNVAEAVTLTAQSSLSPSVVATSVLTAKTPAPVLLVDEARWYDVQDSYIQALTQAGVAHDIWHMNQGSLPDLPVASRLAWYPIVVWFTGYDWYDPVNPTDEATLATFLDGGGRLFLSSPFYLDTATYWGRTLPAFARTRLGVMDWADNLTTTVAYGAAGDPIGDGLGLLPLTNPYPHAGFFTLAGALAPERSAATALRGDSDRALAIHLAEPNSRSAFMITPFEAFTGEGAARVMRRIVGWLGWLGDSTLAADRDVAAAGARVAFELAARNNGPAPASAAMTATLPLSVTLDLTSLSPVAGFDPATRAVTWTGTLAPGAAITVTYQVTLDVALPAGTPLTTTAVFRDDTHGIPFDQLAVVRVASPDLTPGSFNAPSPVRPSAPLIYTLVISNSGLAPAPSAHATVLLPMQTAIVSGSLGFSGPGSITTSSGVVGWHGPLGVGETATLTYQLSTTGILTSTSLLSEALLGDGEGGAWERRVEVDIVPYRFYLPLLRK